MSAPTLKDLLNPDRTAIVTQELQGAVVGPDSGMAELAHEARRHALPNIGRLLPVARDAGVRVVHCLVHRRDDNQARTTTQSSSRSDATPPPWPRGARELPSAGTRAGTVRLGVDPHARSMIDHTLSVLATITTTDNILSMWSGDASRDAGSPL